MKSQTIFPLRLLTSTFAARYPRPSWVALPWPPPRRPNFNSTSTRTPLTSPPPDGDNTNTNTRKRKLKWTTSYSNMTETQSEQRLGFRILELMEKAKPVEKVLRLVDPEVKYNLQDTKEKVYGRIVEYLEVELYPTTASESFKEVNIHDLVFAILSPIMSDFRHKSNRTRTGIGMKLLREKEIISVDSETGEMEEFVVMDIISLEEQKFVLVVEAKRSNMGSAMKQLLLSLKDMRDLNGQGRVYGFATTGDCWQMVIYDGSKFEATEDFKVVFPSMAEDKKRWLQGYSVLVDLIFIALGNGGKG